MAIINSCGSLSQTSSSRKNEYVEPVVDIQPPSPEQRLLDDFQVKTACANDDVLDPDRFQATMNALKQYADGATLKVTYFQIMRNTEIKTGDSDVTVELDPIHRNYRQINEFEIKLDKDFDFSFGEHAENDSQIVGTGLVYPGFNPSIGDCFWYQIDDDLYGQFQITKIPSRLSISSQSWHQITFKLQYYATLEQRNIMLKAVREIFYFNRDKFSNQTAGLLTADEQVTLINLRKLQYQLKHYYVSSFYDNHYCMTFMRPDGVYDPYLGEFIRQSITFEDGPIYLQNPMTVPDNYNNSIWYRLLNPEDQLFTLLNYYYCGVVMYSCMDTNISSLINRNYVILQESSTAVDGMLVEVHAYPIQIPSPDSVNTFDVLMTNFLVNLKIDTDVLQSTCRAITTQDQTTQFYQIPVLLLLLRQCILSMTH